MKKVKLLLTMAVIIATIICCSISAFALTEGDFEFQLINNEVMITKYVGSGGDVIIPESIYGCPVTQFGPGVFNNKSAVTSIKIEAKATELSKEFALGVDALVEVTIPEGVKKINHAAFRHCDNLETVNLPSTVETIENIAFQQCPKLKNITLPNGLKTVGMSAFSSSGIEEITIPASIKEAGQFMFENCASLKKVVFDEGCEIVFDNMFEQCEALKEVKLASTITTIDRSAFYECSSLSELVLPSSLKEVKESAFSKTALKEIILPYGVEIIGKLCHESKELKSVYIPDTVTTIYGMIGDQCPNAIVYCADGSKAAEYCQKKKISYLTDSSVNSGIHVLYNGKRISFHSYGQNPEILEGRTLVPLRSIFEAMGADVNWDGATSTATAKRGNTEVKITIGANEIYKNGNAVPVDVPAQLMNNRTMVPARVIAETFGADVKWNGNGRIVFITE